MQKTKQKDQRVKQIIIIRVLIMRTNLPISFRCDRVVCRFNNRGYLLSMPTVLLLIQKSAATISILHQDSKTCLNRNKINCLKNLFLAISFKSSYSTTGTSMSAPAPVLHTFTTDLPSLISSVLFLSHVFQVESYLICKVSIQHKKS